MAKAVLALVIMSAANTLGKYNRDREGLVVQGTYADIKDFGYTAYLAIQCEKEEEDNTLAFSCGSSILNHKFLLTAAHCLAGCKKSSFLCANVGSVDKLKGIKQPSSNFEIHKNYGFPEMNSDIALVKLKGTLKFGSNVYRIALMRNPSYEKVAVVSGWGLTDELKQKRERLMKYTEQRIWRRSNCEQLIEDLPIGSFCAGEKKANSYASFGDSGGPLVVKNSIQIGIVSYKMVSVSRSLAVYTNASYYYKWIRDTAKDLNC